MREGEETDACCISEQLSDGGLRFILGSDIACVALLRKVTDEFNVGCEPDLRGIEWENGRSMSLNLQPAQST